MGWPGSRLVQWKLSGQAQAAFAVRRHAKAEFAETHLCRTVDAGCTAAKVLERPRATRMPGSMGSIRLGRKKFGSWRVPLMARPWLADWPAFNSIEQNGRFLLSITHRLR